MLFTLFSFHDKTVVLFKENASSLYIAWTHSEGGKILHFWTKEAAIVAPFSLKALSLLKLAVLHLNRDLTLGDFYLYYRPANQQRQCCFHLLPTLFLLLQVLKHLAFNLLLPLGTGKFEATKLLLSQYFGPNTPQTRGKDDSDLHPHTKGWNQTRPAKTKEEEQESHNPEDSLCHSGWCISGPSACTSNSTSEPLSQPQWCLKPRQVHLPLIETLKFLKIDDKNRRWREKLACMNDLILDFPNGPKEQSRASEFLQGSSLEKGLKW